MSESTSEGSDRSESSESFRDCYDFQDEFEEAPIDQASIPPDSSTTNQDDVDEGAYQDEPIASAEWVESYNQRQKEITELESELKMRLAGEVPVSDW